MTIGKVVQIASPQVAQVFNRRYIDLALGDVFYRPEQGISAKMALAPKNRGKISRKFGFYSKQLNRYIV